MKIFDQPSITTITTSPFLSFLFFKTCLDVLFFIIVKDNCYKESNMTITFICFVFFIVRLETADFSLSICDIAQLYSWKREL